MKTGYQAELNHHQKNLNEIKSKLEEFYSERHEDKAIEEEGELKTRFENLLKEGDMAMLSFSSGVKILKSAIAP